MVSDTAKGKLFRQVVWHFHRRHPLRRVSGFTYVEILITLTIVAILFVPMMQLFSQAMDATFASRDLIVALSLARWEMERIKNLGVSTQRLRSLWEADWPPERKDSPFEFAGRSWRIERTLNAETDLMEVTVTVSREGQKRPLATLSTLLTDSSWEQKR